MQPQRTERGLLEARHVVENPHDELVDVLAAQADEARDPGRLNVAQHSAEVGLERSGGKFAHLFGAGAFQQGEQRPWTARPQVRVGPLRQDVRRLGAVGETAAIVRLRAVVEDVIGDPGVAPVRVVGVRGEEIDNGVGVADRQGLPQAAQVTPGAPNQVSQRPAADLAAAAGVGHVEARRQGAVNLRVALRLRLLENLLQGAPRAVGQPHARNDLQQAGPREQTLVLPKLKEDFVELQSIRKGYFRVGRLQRLELFNAIVSLFLARLAMETGGLDLAQELGEGEGAFANRRLRLLVGLRCQSLDQLDHPRIFRFPGTPDVVQMKLR